MPKVKNQKSQTAICRLNGNNHLITESLKSIAKSFNSNYQWTEEIINVYTKLANYFYGIEHELDLNKGIALIGTYGVGKSTIFNIWHEHLKTKHPFCKNLFINSSLEEILEDVTEHGYINRKFVLNLKEGPNGSRVKDPKHILINEFGHRYDIKTYGTDINELFESFMMKRYDLFQQHKKLTHITSNYGTKEFKEMFHPKLYDRFKEMFNIIELKGLSFRK